MQLKNAPDMRLGSPHAVALLRELADKLEAEGVVVTSLKVDQYDVLFSGTIHIGYSWPKEANDA